MPSAKANKSNRAVPTAAGIANRNPRKAAISKKLPKPQLESPPPPSVEESDDEDRELYEDNSEGDDDEDDDELNEAAPPRKVLNSVDNESSITTTPSMSMNSVVTSSSQATSATKKSTPKSRVSKVPARRLDPPPTDSLDYVNDPLFLGIIDTHELHILDISASSMEKMESESHYQGIVDANIVELGYYVMYKSADGTLIKKFVDKHYKQCLTFEFRLLAKNVDVNLPYRTVLIIFNFITLN